MNRLDHQVAKQFNMSRQKAQDAINATRVSVNGVVITKASFLLKEDDVITLEPIQVDFVSRSGFKLHHLLVDYKIDVKGKSALDIGASTGGFTDCLLHHKAANVVAVDVGHQQLHDSLRNHPAVIVMEDTDIRSIKPDDFATLFDIIVIDVSFISIEHIIDHALSLLKNGGECIILIKPQFEVGRFHHSKQGVVYNQKIIQTRLQEIQEIFAGKGLRIISCIPAALTGRAGNQEYFFYMSYNAMEESYASSNNR